MITTIDGATLSSRNTHEVLANLPTATKVGGFRQWLAAGRVVAKGETAIWIWAPAARRKGDEAKGPRFLRVPVFDISQTVEKEQEAQS